jgi:hypothetical protein
MQMNVKYCLLNFKNFNMQWMAIFLFLLFNDEQIVSTTANIPVKKRGSKCVNILNQPSIKLFLLTL